LPGFPSFSSRHLVFGHPHQRVSTAFPSVRSQASESRYGQLEGAFS
jgi:hypothetical protein